MHRFTSLSSSVVATLVAVGLAGCFGNGLGIFDSEPLVDEYTGFDQEIRGNYALGSPVTFEANLDDGMSGTVDIQVPEQFTVVERGSDSVSTTAAAAGRGEVTISLDGDRLGRYDTRVAPVERLEFRRVFNYSNREDYDDTQVFHTSAVAEVVVDFYAADGTRLYGRSITDVPASPDWRVRSTSNNDRVELLSRLDGVYEIPLSVNGVEVASVAFERVEAVETFDIRLETDGDLRTVRAVATDGSGRPVIVAPNWSVDGDEVDALAPLEFIGIGAEGGSVEASLGDETLALRVPAR